jgi:tetratricopeptide (TPR) repeat protein
MSLAKELTDAEVAAKLQLKEGQEIVHKNGKRYLMTPLTDEMIEKVALIRAKEKELSKMVENVPKPSPIHKASTKMYWDGRRLMETDKLDEALPHFSDYITAFNKESATAKNEDKAEHDFYLSWGYQCRGYCYLQKKKYREGIADLTDAIKLRPNYPTNYMNRAKAYRLIHNALLAEADDAKVRSLPKLSGNVYANLSHEFPTTKPDGGTGADGGKVADVAKSADAKKGAPAATSAASASGATTTTTPAKAKSK